jgi:hypothetical protein
MVSTLWTLPVPSTALLKDASFEVLLGRNCALKFEYEDEEDNIAQVKLLLQGVEAFKCTYLFACTVGMITTAYDKVVDLGTSEWLDSIRKQVRNNDHDAKELKHLMIYFDDGPCYEFVCRAFNIEQSAESLNGALALNSKQ